MMIHQRITLSFIAWVFVFSSIYNNAVTTLPLVTGKRGPAQEQSIDHWEPIFQNQNSTDTGIWIEGAFVYLHGSPGLTYVHHIVVHSGQEAPDMDIRISANGLGQYPDGGFVAIPPDQDNSPYSGRTYITSISNPNFHLEKRQSIVVDVTITVPMSFQRDSKYAMLMIDCIPFLQPGSLGDSVGIVTNYAIPVVIVSDDRQSDVIKGEIQKIDVGTISADQAVTVTVNFKNTGNRHYRITGIVNVKDPSGNLAVEAAIPLTSISILPTFLRVINVTTGLLAQVNPGLYRINVDLFTENGDLLASGEVQQWVGEQNTVATATATNTNVPSNANPKTSTMTPWPWLVSTKAVTPSRTVIANLIPQTATLTLSTGLPSSQPSPKSTIPIPLTGQILTPPNKPSDQSEWVFWVALIFVLVMVAILVGWRKWKITRLMRKTVIRG